MYDYYDEPPYYEPSVADEILMEFQHKMKDALLENVKLEIENIKQENKELKEENKELRDKIRFIENRERTLEYREKDIEGRIKREFYKKKFSEIFTPYEDKMILWVAESKAYLHKKCNLCDEKRQITYTSPDGDAIKKDCKCKQYYYKYVPIKANIKIINLYKSDSYEKKFVITPKYGSGQYDKDYGELKISYVFETFDPAEVEDIELKYDCYIGFKTKEECQKYCKWLNNKKNNACEEEDIELNEDDY